MIPQLVTKIRRSLARDRDLSFAERLRKGWGYLLATTLAPAHLRACDRVGARARTIGRPIVRNDGTIEIGDDAVVNSTFAPVELIAARGGRLTVGDNVRVNYGTSITAAASVTIGDDVGIGPYSIIADCDVPLESDASSARTSPVVIGRGVWLAGRVTVLPGSRIGDGAVITAGSVVSGEIPPGVIAGGIPARPVGTTSGAPTQPAERSPLPTSALPVAAELPTASAAPALTGIVLADFTPGDLAVRLRDPSEAPSMIVADAPFCQTAQTLLAGAPEGARDFVVVWTRPELAIPSFQRLLDGTEVSSGDLDADVDAFVQLLARGASQYRFAFVASWVMPAHHRGLGVIDARPGGLAWALARMNLRLMEQAGALPDVFVLDAGRWVAAAARGRYSPRGWYLGKIPFGAEVFAEAARDIKAAVRGLTGGARKLLVLDLDDTLWGGIVGDAGWENLQLGGHDGIGEAFVDFQRAIKALTRRGIVLGIVSKNTEEVALEAMRSHPEMVLRPEDFVGWRINWSDKARNIADLAAELNLGLQSVVFIDDNPVERARVRETLPEVYVPEWPEDKLHYPSELLNLRCFDTSAVSREDAERSQLYAAERERNALRSEIGSIDEWLTSLGIAVRVEPLAPSNLARAAQLLNKTNQMNLTTRRLTESELAEWANDPSHALWTVTVSDRFGSAGLTGILGLEASGDECTIVDFVLSCRVMGRRIEETMTHVAVEWARSRGLATTVARYLPTKKNKPCHDFWKGSGFASDESATVFSWDDSREYPLPAFVALERTADARR